MSPTVIDPLFDSDAKKKIPEDKNNEERVLQNRELRRPINTKSRKKIIAEEHQSSSILANRSRSRFKTQPRPTSPPISVKARSSHETREDSVKKAEVLLRSPPSIIVEEPYNSTPVPQKTTQPLVQNQILVQTTSKPIRSTPKQRSNPVSKQPQVGCFFHLKCIFYLAHIAK